MARLCKTILALGLVLLLQCAGLDWAGPFRGPSLPARIN